MKPKVGDERFLLEVLNTSDVEALARKNGWTGGEAESLRDYCEPEDAATYTTHYTLASATRAAKRDLAKGDSFYGCALIDREVFEVPSLGDGTLIAVPPTWERQESYEVAMDGEVINVFR
jgi:hypothetical protein